MSIIQKNFTKSAKGVIISDVNMAPIAADTTPSPAMKSIVGRAQNAKP